MTSFMTLDVNIDQCLVMIFYDSQYIIFCFITVTHMMMMCVCVCVKYIIPFVYYVICIIFKVNYVIPFL